MESWFSSSFSQKQNAASWPPSPPFRLWPPFFVVVLCLHGLCHAAKCNLSNQCGVLTVRSQSVILWCLFLKPTQMLIFQVEGWMDGWSWIEAGYMLVQMLALLTSCFLVNIFFKKVFAHTFPMSIREELQTWMNKNLMAAFVDCRWE